jgi:hypothetical protein
MLDAYTQWVEKESELWYEHYKIFQNLDVLHQIKKGLKAASLIITFSPGRLGSLPHSISTQAHYAAVQRRIKELEATSEPQL